MRLAIEAVVQRLNSTEGRLVDFGCGGGELCIHAARLGMQATGVDIAEGMVSEARKRRESLPAGSQNRVTFATGDVLTQELPAGEYDAVTALGLIEYLPDDYPLFQKAYALLRPGGVLVVSCRNRLFNMTSLNEYTRRELESGSAAALLSETASLVPRELPHDRVMKVFRKLEAMIPRLEEALGRDFKDRKKDDGTGKHLPPFGAERRQHTPREVGHVARAIGFVEPVFMGVHPHLLPLALQTIVPHFYNELSAILEPFEDLPISLVWSSAFLAAFRKPN